MLWAFRRMSYGNVHAYSLACAKHTEPQAHSKGIHSVGLFETHTPSCCFLWRLGWVAEQGHRATLHPRQHQNDGRVVGEGGGSEAAAYCVGFEGDATFLYHVYAPLMGSQPRAHVLGVKRHPIPYAIRGGEGRRQVLVGGEVGNGRVEECAVERAGRFRQSGAPVSRQGSARKARRGAGRSAHRS